MRRSREQARGATPAPRDLIDVTRGKRVLFIGGSINQTTQMERVADALPEVRATFAPYYQDGWGNVALALGLLETTIGGRKLQRRCMEHLAQSGREIDPTGDKYAYDAVVLSTDQRFMLNIRRKPVVLLQEGIVDEPNVLFPLIRRFPRLPRWWANTAATGLSKMYARFCVASDGYRDYFASIGCDPEKLEVTGIPNFDDCDAYRQNHFPHRGYVLVCTSDARETWKGDDRRGFIEHASRIAARVPGRRMIFKLHPNENVPRAMREIDAWAPGSLVFSEGKAEEMVANCDVLVCQYSSLAFVGIALGKEVHSYVPEEKLRRLMPVQNRSAATNVARVVRRLLVERATCGLVDSSADCAPWRPAAARAVEVDSQQASPASVGRQRAPGSASGTRAALLHAEIDPVRH